MDQLTSRMYWCSQCGTLLELNPRVVCRPRLCNANVTIRQSEAYQVGTQVRSADEPGESSGNATEAGT